MNNWAITSGKNLSYAESAFKLSETYHLRYIPRTGGIDTMLEKYALDHIFVLNNEGLSLLGKNGQPPLSFHPGMAVQKQRQHKAGQEDYLIKALEPKENMRILDCTLGLASDSINIAAQIPNCTIDGLESSFGIYVITHYGISNYQSKYNGINNALKRIQVYHDNYSNYLNKTTKYYDVVYFDPMFEHTSQHSENINQLRPFANHQKLQQKDIDAALQIAPKVIIKHRKNSLDFQFDKIYQGKYSPIAFGVIERGAL